MSSKPPAPKINGRSDPQDPDFFYPPTDYDAEERVAICKAAVKAARDQKEIDFYVNGITEMGKANLITDIIKEGNALQAGRKVEELKEIYEEAIDSSVFAVPQAEEKDIRLASNPAYK